MYKPKFVPMPDKFGPSTYGRREATFPRPILSYLGFQIKRKRELVKQNQSMDLGDIQDCHEDYLKYVEEQKRLALNHQTL